MPYPAINPSSLEQPANLFYGRLRVEEQDKVREIVEGLVEHMDSTTNDDYLIAGVGGILRRPEPHTTRDIDLAVVGYKFAPLEGHNFGHVSEFTGMVNSYFERLSNSLSFGGLETSEVSLGKGSGPLSLLGLNRRKVFRMHGEEVATAEARLESFGQYCSKGMQVRFNGLRPIDVQFSFNMTPTEWREYQASLENSGRGEGQFFYSVLSHKD